MTGERPARLPSRRSRTAASAALALALALGGCSDPMSTTPDPSGVPGAAGARSSAISSAGASPGGSSTPAGDRAELQRAVDALVAAGGAGDRPGWDARTSLADPDFAGRSAVLFDNLSSLPLERVRIHLTGTQATLPDARRRVLGADAHVLQARLSWRLPHERADATSTVWLTLVPGPDGYRLAGTGDGSGLDAPAQPLWWLGSVTEAARGQATVLAGPGQDAGRWAALADRAARDARRNLLPRLGRDWDGRVVVQVPGTEADFTSVLGAAPSAYAGTAAVTRPEGPTTDAAPRVVVNPATSGESDDELGLLLAHETVHVATRSASSPAPLWAVEGLAEHVALRAHPDRRTDELAALRGRHPADLPPDTAFGAGARDVTAAYAQAWLICRAVADHRGEAGLGRLYAALGDGRTLAQAAHGALGVDGATVARWARDERRRAGVS